MCVHTLVDASEAEAFTPQECGAHSRHVSDCYIVHLLCAQKYEYEKKHLVALYTS